MQAAGKVVFKMPFARERKNNLIGALNVLRAGLPEVSFRAGRS